MPVHLSLEAPREPPFSFDGVERRPQTIRDRHGPVLFVHAAKLQALAIAEVDLERHDALASSQRRLDLGTKVNMLP